VQKNTLHILVVMMVAMRVVMISVIMTMAMVRMSEGCQAHNVDEEAQNTYYQQLVQAMQLMALP
jgi:hypothetical protein